jgi:hypothetical protein
MHHSRHAWKARATIEAGQVNGEGQMRSGQTGTEMLDGGSAPAGRRWSVLMWSAAALLLLTALVAMQVTDEVDWDGTDFLVMGTMLFSACGVVELALRARAGLAYRAGVVVAVGAAFLLVWINLAVGFLGNTNNPANLMFAGVLGIGLVGSLLARFRPRGMAWALAATALAQAAVGVIALAYGLERTWVVAAASAVFVAAWALSAGLFRVAANQVG